MKRLSVMAVAVVSLTVSATRAADRPLLASLFSDHAVLQRGREIPVWGWAHAGEKVTVHLGDQNAEAVAGAEGRWQAKLAAMPAGGPFELTVSTAGKSFTAKDILIGDVWLCSGQSNMEFRLDGSEGAAEAIAHSANSNLRLLQVDHVPAVEPREAVGGEWTISAPETSKRFSAVGWYFGSALQRDLGVPIGLVHSSWGGTPIQAWMSAEALSKLPDEARIVKQLRQDAETLKTTYHGDLAAMREAWWKANDPGSAGTPAKNADLALDDSGWKTVDGMPKNYPAAGLGNFAGITWWRCEVQVPEGWAGQELTLEMPGLSDEDSTFFNGQKIGENYVAWQDRKYKVLANDVRAGRNVIAVRMRSGAGGGFWNGKIDLKRADGQALDLASGWKVQKGPAQASLPHEPDRLGQSPFLRTVLYNGMIHPLEPLAIKGAIWYQGESNANWPKQYEGLLSTMISSWRQGFASDFAFGIVQLPGYGARHKDPVWSNWAGLRESQAKVASEVPGCGLAVTLDVGEGAQIHPIKKRQVGERLALWAEAKVYGKGVEYSGPVFKQMSVEGKQVRVEFTHAEGLRARDGGEVKGFAVAGQDHVFRWANATIEGSSVVLTADGVEHPAAVRYAWDDDPACNLENGEGLPAGTFRTDDWGK